MSTNSNPQPQGFSTLSVPTFSVPLLLPLTILIPFVGKVNLSLCTANPLTHLEGLVTEALCAPRVSHFGRTFPPPHV